MSHSQECAAGDHEHCALMQPLAVTLGNNNTIEHVWCECDCHKEAHKRAQQDLNRMRARLLKR